LAPDSGWQLLVLLDVFLVLLVRQVLVRCSEDLHFPREKCLGTKIQALTFRGH
jgi:hypothetical protein